MLVSHMYQMLNELLLSNEYTIIPGLGFLWYSATKASPTTIVKTELQYLKK